MLGGEFSYTRMQMFLVHSVENSIETAFEQCPERFYCLYQHKYLVAVVKVGPLKPASYQRQNKIVLKFFQFSCQAKFSLLFIEFKLQKFIYKLHCTLGHFTRLVY